MYDAMCGNHGTADDMLRFLSQTVRLTHMLMWTARACLTRGEPTARANAEADNVNLHALQNDG